MYKKEQVLEESIRYFRQDSLAANKWIEKYEKCDLEYVFCEAINKYIQMLKDR